MRKTIIAMLAAAAVLVVGGAVGALAQTDTTSTTTATTDTAPFFGRHADGPRAEGPHLQDLLDEMVTDGVITDAQASDISTWLEEKRATMEQDREARQAAFQEAWSDGVLTTEEAQALGGNGPLLDPNGPLADAWADGQLTKAEVQAFQAQMGPRGHHRGGFGPGGFDQDAPAATNSSLGA